MYLPQQRELGYCLATRNKCVIANSKYNSTHPATLSIVTTSSSAIAVRSRCRMG